MPEFKPPRPGEVAIDLPSETDAGVHFIGRIRTPWKTTAECPKNSRLRSGIVATIEIDPRYAAGLQDIMLFSHAIALYWLDQSRRDLIAQIPSHLSAPRGVFALRSPVRPNPIGLAVVELVALDGTRLSIGNIDCVDGTPLIDLKPYFASIDSEPGATRPA
ncbi:MAG: tRNA (N6-threonylcarbamoyladenosine(37)-N6)-methyltransferase TrmO [Hyphomicrobium sp.]